MLTESSSDCCVAGREGLVVLRPVQRLLCPGLGAARDDGFDKATGGSVMVPSSLS
jgi:hypothetical protein